MKIIYTKHAKDKFAFLRELGFSVKKTDIKKALTNPDYHREDLERNAEFVLKKISKNQNLRVIYARKDDIIIVITFHPSGKGRYIK